MRAAVAAAPRRTRSRRSRIWIGCTGAGSSRRRSTSRRSRERASSSWATAVARPARPTCSGPGLNARTLTPPIDPNELATDSPGDRGRPADGAPRARRPAGRSICRIRTRSAAGSATATPTSFPIAPRRALVVGDAARRALRPRTSPRGWASRPRASRCRSRGRSTTCASRRASRIPILVGRDNRLVQDLVKIGRARPRRPAPGRRRRSDRAARVRRRDGDGRGRRRRGRHRRRQRSIWRGACRTCGTSAAARCRSATCKTELCALPRRQERRRTSRRRRWASSSDLLAELVARDARHGRVKSFDVEAVPRGGRRRARRVSDQRNCASAGVKREGDGQERGDHRADAGASTRRSTCPWEVDEFWTRLRADVLPKITAGADRRRSRRGSASRPNTARRWPTRCAPS